MLPLLTQESGLPLVVDMTIERIAIPSEIIELMDPIWIDVWVGYSYKTETIYYKVEEK